MPPGPHGTVHLVVGSAGATLERGGKRVYVSPDGSGQLPPLAKALRWQQPQASSWRP